MFSGVSKEISGMKWVKCRILRAALILIRLSMVQRLFEAQILLDEIPLALYQGILDTLLHDNELGN